MNGSKTGPQGKIGLTGNKGQKGNAGKKGPKGILIHANHFKLKNT